MPDYSQTVIYKIVCNDLNVTNCYVGSTTNFRRRKCEHKSRCANENSKGYNFKCYKLIRDNGGWENWSMYEIEKFPCADANEARARERYWHEQLNSSLNQCVPNRTLAEYYQNNKDKISEYYQNNKDKISEKQNQKITCECGCEIIKRNIPRHRNSKKHQGLMANLETSNDQ